MKELIEKLKNARDYIKGRTQSISVALKFEELELLLQAITSVKSEQVANNSEAMKWISVEDRLPENDDEVPMYHYQHYLTNKEK